MFVKLTDKVAASEDVVAREVGGETVLLDLASGTYFGLNEVGGRVWELIDGAGLTLDQICTHIEAEFEVRREVLEGDIASLMQQLAERSLIRQEAA